MRCLHILDTVDDIIPPITNDWHRYIVLNIGDALQCIGLVSDQGKEPTEFRCSSEGMKTLKSVCVILVLRSMTVSRTEQCLPGLVEEGKIKM
jgi:hypothetical protein